MSHHFADRLHAALQQKRTAALVGLDPRVDWLPAEIMDAARARYTDPVAVAAAAMEEFCVRIIDVVAPLVAVVKPQAAFFERYGSDGCLALQRISRYARAQGLLVIMDAKRGDIGTTAEAYAEAFLAGEDPQASPWGADALTVNPYLGADTLQPFVKVAEQRGAGIYVLVKTSNPGAGHFQDVGSPKVFEVVAAEVERLSAASRGELGYGVVGAVVGATYPQELAALRAAMPTTPLLIPGYGSQGGTAADVAAAFDDRGLGAVVNNSRGINFAYRDGKYKDRFGEARWEEAVLTATQAMIRDLAQHVVVPGV